MVHAVVRSMVLRIRNHETIAKHDHREEICGIFLSERYSKQDTSEKTHREWSRPMRERIKCSKAPSSWKTTSASPSAFISLHNQFDSSVDSKLYIRQTRKCQWCKYRHPLWVVSSAANIEGFCQQSSKILRGGIVQVQCIQHHYRAFYIRSDGQSLKYMYLKYYLNTLKYFVFLF